MEAPESDIREALSLELTSVDSSLEPVDPSLEPVDSSLEPVDPSMEPVDSSMELSGPQERPEPSYGLGYPPIIPLIQEQIRSSPFFLIIITSYPFHYILFPLLIF